MPEYNYFYPERRGGNGLMVDSKGAEIVVLFGPHLANNRRVLRSNAIAGGGFILHGPRPSSRRGLAIGPRVSLLPDYPRRRQALYALSPPGRICGEGAELRGLPRFYRFGGELQGTASEGERLRF